MTQHYLGQIPDTSQESGNDLAARLNSFDNGHRTNQSGPTRPAGILPGGVWTRVVGGVYDLMLFDGAQDRVVMRGDQNLSGLADLERARQNLGLGKLATKDKAHIVNETEGTLPVARGGTGGGTQAAARQGIGLTDHSTAVWKAGTATERGTPSPSQLAQAIAEVSPKVFGDTWVDVTSSRLSETQYQNTTGYYIVLCVSRTGRATSAVEIYVDGLLVGRNSDWQNDGDRAAHMQAIVPPGSMYMHKSSNGFIARELR